jgi:hypothetical protein
MYTDSLMASDLNLIYKQQSGESMNTFSPIEQPHPKTAELTYIQQVASLYQKHLVYEP